jgi:hypothetical protein
LGVYEKLMIPEHKEPKKIITAELAEDAEEISIE